MRYFYTLLYYLLLPAIMVRLLWRSRQAPAYRKRLGERFGYFIPATKSTGLWVHAVSLGEVITATPLIRAFQQQFPEQGVVVTTMTPTGSERVRAVFGDSILHVYIPYDLPSMLKRFIAQTRPHILVIMETELWPNLLYCCHQQNIPILLANARLSLRSAKKYHKIASLTRAMLNHLTHIAVQSQPEAERFIALGMPPQRISVTGSIKFDISLPPDLSEKAQNLRRLLGQSRPIWIAASTHEGEEELILKAFATVRLHLNALLVLVPRHPERFSKVANLCRNQGFEVVLRSENQPCTPQTDIFLGNTMGELLLFYAASDVAFVGGSLVPLGGHNLLEPAALGKAAITGPYMDNFTEITSLLLQARAIKQIQDVNQLASTVIELLQNPALREQMGRQGEQVVAQNRGALQKHMQIIQSLYPSMHHF